MTTESAGSVDLTIRVFSHPGGAPQPFSLLVNTEVGTASMSETIMIIHLPLSNTGVVDNDYVPVSGQVIQFSAGDVTKFHSILINDDIECEKDPNENLFFNIAVHSGIPDISVTVPRAHVTIDDTAEPECGKLNSPYKILPVYTHQQKELHLPSQPQCSIVLTYRCVPGRKVCGKCISIRDSFHVHLETAQHWS